MEFPVINLTVYLKEELRTYDNIAVSLFSTKYVYIREKSFLDFMEGCEFADNRGDIYTIIGFGKVPFWRKIVPFSYRMPVIYKRTGESIDFEKIRKLVINGIESPNFSDDLEFKKLLIKGAMKAKSLKEMEYEVFP